MKHWQHVHEISVASYSG